MNRTLAYRCLSPDECKCIETGTRAAPNKKTGSNRAKWTQQRWWAMDVTCACHRVFNNSSCIRNASSRGVCGTRKVLLVCVCVCVSAYRHAFYMHIGTHVPSKHNYHCHQQFPLVKHSRREARTLAAHKRDEAAESPRLWRAALTKRIKEKERGKKEKREGERERERKRA